ncbi:hypothetical protein ABK040_009389 [Willaertia magna]
MSFLEEIKKGVQLKHTERVEVENKKTQLICDDSETYYSLLKEASFENYYDYIKQYTFPSTYFLLTLEEAQHLVGWGKKWKEQFEEITKKKQDQDLNERIDLINRIMKEWKESDTVLQQLALKIDEEKKKLNTNNGIFIRLSTMSPKDAVTNRPSFIEDSFEIYKEIVELEKEQQINFGKEANRQLYALYIASTQTMKVENSFDGIQLLIESDRAQQELTKMVETEGEREIRLIVREFVNFDVGLEFRSFIYNNQLCALSQYNPYVYFPHLVKHQDEILKSIQQFINDRIKEGSIPLRNFSLDILLINNSAKNKTCCSVDNETRAEDLQVKIIEVNALAEFTGTCCFTWEHDRDILMGKKPFEFRLTLKEYDNPLQEFNSEWILMGKRLQERINK